MKLILSLFLLTSMMQTSIYDFQKKSIDGQNIDFTQYQGKTLLIVNTASRCGFTPQYAELQALHEQHGDKITILGFPANNFGAQEPGSNTEIAQFCEKNYGVTFPMFEKISVKGDKVDPLYQWLKDKTGQEPTWNFCKYLVKPDGTVKFFASGIKPMGEEITSELM